MNIYIEKFHIATPNINSNKKDGKQKEPASSISLRM